MPYTHAEEKTNHAPPQELFAGFFAHIEKPLIKSDPDSLRQIERLYAKSANTQTQPFSFLLEKLCAKHFTEREAQKHWDCIIDHKEDMEAKLGRTVSIQTSVVDYFSLLGKTASKEANQILFSGLIKSREEQFRSRWRDQLYAPDLYSEHLKREIQRARRYKHSLSTLLAGVDGLSEINEKLSCKHGDQTLNIIVNIIKKTIRAVDIISRYSGDVFLIILPNTNRREAVELAERIRLNVESRSARLPADIGKTTLTVSAAQRLPEEKSTELIQRLQLALEKGKNQKRNSVYDAHTVCLSQESEKR